MNKNLTLAGAAVVILGLSVVVGSLCANTPSEKNENCAIGEEVFFNPYTGLPCHKANAWSQNNHAGECYRWYVIKDNGDSYDLLLDHNLGAKVPWLSYEDFISAGGAPDEYGISGNNRFGPLTALKELQKATSSFKNVETLTAEDNVSRSAADGADYTIDYTGYKARLISAAELATLSGGKPTEEGNAWQASSGSYIHALPQWLYANLGRPDVAQPEIHVAHYTDTAHTVKSDTVWVVCLGSNLGKASVTTMSRYGQELLGVRPVIKVKKNKLYNNVKHERRK